VAEIAKRNRTNPVQFYLSDDEQYILNTKFKASGMKSMSGNQSAVLAALILLRLTARYALEMSPSKCCSSKGFFP